MHPAYISSTNQWSAESVGATPQPGHVIWIVPTTPQSFHSSGYQNPTPPLLMFPPPNAPLLPPISTLMPTIFPVLHDTLMFPPESTTQYNPLGLAQGGFLPAPPFLMPPMLLNAGGNYHTMQRPPPVMHTYLPNYVQPCPRCRPRSVNHGPQQSDVNISPCRHFLQGKCNRRKCRFLHSLADAPLVFTPVSSTDPPSVSLEGISSNEDHVASFEQTVEPREKII